MKFKSGHTSFILKIVFATWACLAAVYSAHGQTADSLSTGYMLDAAEEFWPLQNDSFRKDVTSKLKHLPVNHNKGSITFGFNNRESYEYFNEYLWGLGSQDKNGFFLHRFLLHTDMRWNKNLRIFTELQSSTITGRLGGPRPIQDLNKLAVNQLFLELTIPAGKRNRLSLRLGEQSLNYGRGTLLDIRDANVRKSFAGGKLILENGRIRIDFFYMHPVAEKKGIFDDKIDHTQKLVGFWATRKYQTTVLNRMDFYYLLIRRDETRFNQRYGKELRHTIGTAATFKNKKGNWFSYSEINLQFGKFNRGNILAWKIAPSLGYQFQRIWTKPVISLQGAVSSGDKDSSDLNIQTFNPLFPKAIYYGFIDNAGSANLIVVHPKADFHLSDNFKITTGYYRFWRQRTTDGIYAVNGSFLLPAANDKHSVGSMWDILITYNVSNNFTVQFIGSYYKRHGYLKEQPELNTDIRYASFKTTLRI